MPNHPAIHTTRATRPGPVLQIRVIGPVDFAHAVLADRADLIRTMLGPDYRYAMQTRTARKAGQVRVYLTITHRKEDNPDDHHDSSG